MSAAAQRAASWHEGILSASARGGFTSPAFRWAIAPALAAWLLLVWLPSDNLALCLSPRATQIDGVLASIAASYGLLNPWQPAAGWTLMIVAMMFPLLVPMIGFVAARNFTVRRERSVALFMGGYGIVWLATAAFASAALIVARAGLAGLGLAAASGFIGCALAALWQISAAKQRAVYRCHGTVALQPFGFAADRAAMRFGLLHGARCMRSCLPTMALPLLGEHGLLTMAVVFVILLAERARVRPQYGLSAAVLLTLGATLLVAPAP